MINLSYKGISSSTYGLFLKSVDRSLFPELMPRILEIPGRHGVMDFYENRYSVRLIKISFTLVKTTLVELRTEARNIASWLNSDEWERLIFDDEPDKFYLARVYDSISLNNVLSTGEFNITFYCQPFAYSVINTGADPEWDNADFPWITSLTWEMLSPYKFTGTSKITDTFENPGNYKINLHSPQGSLSQVVIVGTWTTLSITLNDKTLTYTETVATEKTLIIDNIDMSVTIDNVSKLQYLSGDLETFLEILPGDNDIEIDGTGFNVEVSALFTPMWI